MKGKRCAHRYARQMLRGDDRYTTVAYQCVACLAIGVRPLGKSNDDDNSYVQEEIEAAEIADDPTLALREDGYFSGYRAGWLAHQGDCDPGDVGISWRAGWLASEMIQVDQTTARHLNHDPHAWTWDPTRPLAGQYEEWLRASEAEATTPSRHLDGWTGPDDEHDDMLAMHDTSDDLPSASDCPEHPGSDANDYGDCMECSAMADDPAGMVDLRDDRPLTVSIDSDGTPAVQINGLCDAPPMFSPDDAEAMADDLLLGAGAARQAARDGYHGPAVVVELRIGEEPEHGVEIEIREAHKAGADCSMMGCLEDGSAYDPDDIIIRAGAPEAIGLTPRQLREQTAAAVAAEDALRDPEVMAKNARILAERASRGADLTSTEILDIADAVQRGDLVLPDPEGKP